MVHIVGTMTKVLTQKNLENLEVVNIVTSFLLAVRHKEKNGGKNLTTKNNPTQKEKTSDTIQAIK